MKHTKFKHILLLVIAITMTFVLASCSLENFFTPAEPEKNTEAPTLTVDGAVVSWQSIADAEKYIVYVNGNATETTETSYSLENMKPGAYDIQVQTVKGDEKATSDIVTVKITATLAAPEISLSGNSVSWDAVENATGYEVFVNGESRGTVSGTVYAVLENAVGNYNITVKAVGNDIFFASGLSNEVVYTVNESAPQPISLDAPVISIEGGVLSWTAVTDATTYKIIVNGNESYKTSDTIFTLPVTLGEGNYTIVVKASAPANDMRLDSAASNEVGYSVAPFSLEAPILPVITVEGVEYVLGIDPDGYIRVKPYASVTDFTSNMWYLEKIEGSDYYNIKLFNGKYLAYGNTASDGSETVAIAMTEQSTEFQWHIGGQNADGTFRLFNIAHSQRWSGDQFVYYYGHKENVVKFGDNCIAISFVNRDIPFVPLTALSTPVVEMNGATATWSAVENAVGYDVYVNGEKVATQTETSYTLNEYGTIYVVAKADGENYLDSEKSETKAYSLDLTQPILPIIVEQSVKYIIKIDTDGFVKYAPFDGVSDFETNMWYLEKDGDFYNIKLFDGRYLAWEDGKSSGGHESFAVLKDAAGNASIQWHITITDQGEYAIYNVGHSNKWSGGNWQYNYCIWDGVLKFASGPKFTFENRDIPFDPDNAYVPPVVEEPDPVEKVDLTKPVVFVANNENIVMVIDSNGRLVKGDAFANITDYTACAWLLEAEGEYYKIRLTDGRYLMSPDGNTIVAKAYDAADADRFLWTLKDKGNNAYNLFNKAVGNYTFIYDGSEVKFYGLGESDPRALFTLHNVEGVTFADPQIKPVTPPACTEHTDANGDYICDNCQAELEKPEPENESFYAWLYYNDANQTLAETDANGVVIIGGKFDSITDYNSYIWYFEAINEGANDGYYRIMQGGKYLTKATTNVGSGHTAEAQFLALDEANDAQYWLLVADGEGRFFIYNKTLGTAHKFGEFYGVYKFGGNNSWTFTKTDAPVITPPEEEPDTPATLTDIPADSAFSAWLYYNDGNQTLAVVNPDGIMIIGGKYDSTLDHADHTFIFEPVDVDGIRYYRIRLGDLYLAKATTTLTGGGSDTAEAQFTAFNAASDAQLWKLTKEADGKYFLYNKSVGDHKYGEWWGVYKFGANNSWTFNDIKIVESTPPEAEEEESKSFTAWLYYNDANQTVADVNSDGVAVIGAKYDTLDDSGKVARTWTFEYAAEGDYAGCYMIKLADGKYLTYADSTNVTNNGHTAQTCAAEKNTSDAKQYWKLVADGEGKFKLENKHLSNYYSNVYLGEYWGVYKFDGVCTSWVFNDIISV